MPYGLTASRTDSFTTIARPLLRICVKLECDGVELPKMQTEHRLLRDRPGPRACDLFVETYDDAGASITSSIVTSRAGNDTALYRVCQRRGIRVHLREWAT